MSQVPIESDADAGFASRTRKVRAARAEAHARHAHGHGHGHDGSRRAVPFPTAGAASQSAASVPEMLLRRRKGSGRRVGNTGAPDGLPASSRSDIGGAGVPRISLNDEIDSEATPRSTAQDLAHVQRHQGAPRSSDPPPRYGGIGEAFRHYRTSSLSAFPTFPFRRTHASPGTVQDEPSAIEESESASASGTDHDTDRTPRPSSLSLGAQAASRLRNNGGSRTGNVAGGGTGGDGDGPNGQAARHRQSSNLSADTAPRRSRGSFASWFRSTDLTSSGSEDDYVGPGMDMDLDPAEVSEEEIRYSREPVGYGEDAVDVDR